MQLLLQMLVSEKTTAERATHITVEGESSSFLTSEVFSLDETAPEMPLMGADALTTMPETDGFREVAEEESGLVAEMWKTTGPLIDAEAMPALPTTYTATLSQPEMIEKGANTAGVAVDIKSTSTATLTVPDCGKTIVLPDAESLPQDGRLSSVDVPPSPKAEAIKSVVPELDRPKDMTSREGKVDTSAPRTASVPADSVSPMPLPQMKVVQTEGVTQLASSAANPAPIDMKIPAAPIADVSEQGSLKTPPAGAPVVALAKGDVGDMRFEVKSRRTKQAVIESTGAISKQTNQNLSMPVSQPSFTAISAMHDRPVMFDGSVGREPLFPVASDPGAAGIIEAVEEKRPLQPALRPDQVARPVMQQVTQGLMRSNLEGSVEIRLWPEELGKVRLAMSPSDVGLTVMVTAERPETLDLMRRHIDMLEADLRENGFDGLEFQFGEGHEKQTDADRSSVSAEDDGSHPTTGQALTTNAVASPGIADGRLDIRV